MNYFLAKTDPETYSIQDLAKEGQTIWDGVHNYTAIAVIKSWKPNDLVLIYHSQSEKKIVGLMQVVGEPYKDPNDIRNISWVAPVKYIKTFPAEHQISLQQIKESGLFSDFVLLRQPRLSTMPCPENFINWLQQKNIID